MPRALLLFSEELDSLLSGLLLRDQGFEVIAVRFITPFFGLHLKENPTPFENKIKELGFSRGLIKNITEEFLEILKNPKHGYGCLANPCIDCKILMLKLAKEVLAQVSADFIATGEVLGERPMSQNRQALELIEKESSTKGILLRPLSAKLLPQTEVEKRGLVDRSRLLAIKDRKRTEQLRLAKEYGIKEIPTPAGGCLLTDPVIGQRTLEILKRGFPLTPDTVKLLVLGRHYIEENSWLVLGKNEEENKKIVAIANGKFPLLTLSEPAPILSVIQGEVEEAKLFEVLVSRSKKARLALSEGKKVSLLKV